MRILVACECSGRVRDAFIEEGFDAWSCDLTERDFIDLDCVWRNATICLRDWTRRDEEIDREFKEKYKEGGE